MITIRHRGDFKNIEHFLKNNVDREPLGILHEFGRQGVSALSAATPIDTGITSLSWGYELVKTPKGFKLIWTNSNVAGSVPLVILLQYGHGTSSGAFVQGRDFINPALRPILDKLSENLWEEVTK